MIATTNGATRRTPRPRGALAALALAVGLGGALLAPGCAGEPKRGGGTAAAPGRPEGVRPDVTEKALDPRGLDPRWSFYLGEPVRSMWIVDDAVYVFTAKRNLYCMGLDDGYVRWVFGLKDDLDFAPAAYSYKRDGIARRDELFLISKDRLFCVDKDAGILLWRKELPFAAASAPSASISHVYIGAWDHRIYAIEKSDQSIDWTFRTGAPVTTRAEAAEKTVEAVYVGSEDGAIYAMNPVREERKWVFPTLGKIVARPLFFRNFVYAGSSDFNLYCIRALDGNMEWRYPAGAPITKDPVAYTRETIFVIAGQSDLLAVNLQPDVKKEYVRWSRKEVEGVLAKGRRDLYVLGLDGKVRALVDETGKDRWQSPLTVEADFFATNPYDPTSLVERDKRLASTLVFGYRDGWMIAVKEKSEF
jgi:outer membrane protein assembly factor BamB